MLVLILLLLWNGAQGCTRDELEMVQIISTHGWFSPSFIYPKDPNPASVWTEGLDDLTMLGKFQSYALGAFLRNFYSDFITSDPSELEVVSSADKGVVKSAQSLITSLYAPTSNWEVVQNFPWQPIYIKYDNDEHKFLTNRMCPTAHEEHKSVAFRETRGLLQTYQNLMMYWSTNSGMNLESVSDVEKLFHVLHTEYSHNLTIPEWSKVYWSEMKYLHDVSTGLRTQSEKFKRFQGGHLIDHTVKVMKEKALDDLDSRKLVVYSSHTKPMLGFLATMDLGNFVHLHPCSTLLLELYKHEGSYFVRYLYLNFTMPKTEPQEIYSLQLPGCEEFCSLNYVIEYAQDVIPKNLEQECKSYENHVF